MRRLDFYVQHMLKQNAESIVMHSGEAVEFRFGGGKQRRSNQPISHRQLVQLVRAWRALTRWTSCAGMAGRALRRAAASRSTSWSTPAAASCGAW
jgi:hypothetical protein